MIEYHELTASADALGVPYPPVMWAVELPQWRHEARGGRYWDSLIEYTDATHALELVAVLRRYGYHARVRPWFPAVQHG